MNATAIRIYVVFAYPINHPIDAEFLAAYSTREKAQSFIDAQPPEVQSNLGISEVWLDEHRAADGFWKHPA